MRFVSSFAVAVMFAESLSAQRAPSLGSAASFALLARSGIASAGTSHVTGNVGTANGSVRGLEIVLGGIQRGELLSGALRDSAAAFAALERLPCTPLAAGATRVDPGVHCLSAPLAGTIVLDAHGDRHATWIFIATPALVVAERSAVLVANGGADGNVFWVARDAATIGADATFAGTIFATTITLGPRARLSGRAYARDGPITLDANRVSLCCSPITIAAPPLPRGTATKAYPSRTFDAAGGIAPYAFTASGLPEGMSMAGGVLGGTPRRPGRYPLRVTAVDAAGCHGTLELVLEVDSCLTIEPEVLPPPSCPYETRIEARGCTPPYRFAVTAGTLPSGITLDDDGRLHGRPAAASTATFTITATDADAIAASRTYTLTTIACPPPILFDPLSLPRGKECLPYSASFTGPYTFSTLPETLPPGIVMSGATLSGAPVKKGHYEFPVTAKDAFGNSESRTYAIDVDCPEIAVAPDTLPPGIAGKAYAQQLSSTPCSGTFTMPAEARPPGLTLTPEGLLSGVPLQTGRFTFSVTATSPSGECSATRAYTIDIVCDAIVVAPPAFPAATVGAPYAASLAVDGGLPPYIVKVVSGALPPGLSFSSATLTGTPAAAGTYAFRLRIADAAGCSGGEAAVCALDVQAASCPAGTSLLLTPGSLKHGVPGAPYSQALTVAGGTPPYAFAVTAGSLPAGITLNPVTGIVSGVPLSAGNSAVRITAIDANGCRVSICTRLHVTQTIPTASQWTLLLLAIALAALAVGRIHGE